MKPSTAIFWDSLSTGSATLIVIAVIFAVLIFILYMMKDVKNESRYRYWKDQQILKSWDKFKGHG